MDTDTQNKKVYKLSEETRRKISIANTGKKRTIEQRKRLSEQRKGKTLSPEHRAKISLATKGKPNRTAFKKGNVSWHKGTIGLYQNPLKGKKMPLEWKLKLRKPKSVTHPCSEETKEKIRAIMKTKIGPLNARWKGGRSVYHVEPR